MTEINPNHPVTREVHGQWHKIVAVIMYSMGMKEFRLTEEMIRSMPRDLAVAFDTRGGGACVRLITMAEANDLAKTEGGLSV